MISSTVPVDQPPPIVQAVRATVGVGKSAAYRRDAALLVQDLRKADDLRAIAVAVPTHKLGDEQAALFMAQPEAEGLTALSWRGRRQPDPQAPGETMCRDLARVRDAEAAFLPVQSAVCSRRISLPGGQRTTVRCPCFHECGYQRQRKADADLWFAPHAMLFGERPDTMGELAALVVDESPVFAGLKGVGAADSDGPQFLTLDTIEHARTATVKSGGKGGERLTFLRNRLLDALRTLPDGPVTRASVASTGLTDNSAAEAIKLEFELKRTTDMHPAMTKTERRAAVGMAAENAIVFKLAAMWKAVMALLSPGGPETSGWLTLATQDTKNGKARVVKLKARRDIGEGWLVPTLLLDANLNLDLVRPFWPQVTLVADIEAETPHQRVRQVIDRAYAKSMLAPLEVSDELIPNPKEQARRANRLRDLRAIIVREAISRAPGLVLVVLQKDVETALHALGALPSNIETAHHNAIAGIDRWANADCLIVVGRTMPSPAAAATLAEALTGRAVEARTGWYDRADAVREMADGTFVATDADAHPDPVAEAIRWQVCEGELIQIIGRVRGVNRTERNPVDVLVLTDVPLPLPIAGIIEAAELTPTPADLMMAEGGVVFENARHAAAAYPVLWASHNAADLAMRRSPSKPYSSSILGKRRTPPGANYQLAGAGSKTAHLWFDPGLCPDPAGFVAAKLGVLASFELHPANDPHGATAEPNERDRSPGRDTGDLDEAPLNPESSGPVCDVPWLHPEVPASVAADGHSLLVCPWCGSLHHHHGFGHRLAHCAEPKGRGYVLVDPGVLAGRGGLGWTRPAAPNFSITEGP